MRLRSDLTNWAGCLIRTALHQTPGTPANHSTTMDETAGRLCPSSVQRLRPTTECAIRNPVLSTEPRAQIGTSTCHGSSAVGSAYSKACHGGPERFWTPCLHHRSGAPKRLELPVDLDAVEVVRVECVPNQGNQLLVVLVGRVIQSVDEVRIPFGPARVLRGGRASPSSTVTGGTVPS